MEDCVSAFRENKRRFSAGKLKSSDDEIRAILVLPWCEELPEEELVSAEDQSEDGGGEPKIQGSCEAEDDF
jgi:hypothetical protein